MKNSVNVNETKKVALIKFVLHIALITLSFQLLSQDKIDKAWKKEKSKVEYRKAKKYKGPDDWYTSSPAQINQEEEDLYVPPNGGVPNSANSPGGSQTYTPQQIEEERKRRYGDNYQSGQNGKPDPELIKPEPIEFPDFDAPDVDAPDVDLPDMDAPDFLASGGFWKTILFIVLFLLVIWIIYILLKNRKPADKRVVVQNVENNWHPEVVTKTELELMLDKAMNSGDYRACVRVYFMFILKELTKKQWIKWRAEKTNYDYLLEMRSKSNFEGFEETVRIYDLVWYGDYKITESAYKELQPRLLNYYKSLNPSNE